jgi:receptor protein-tyrosine kinase
MSELRSRFDYILINGTPLAQGSDSEVLGKSADGALLIVAAHATRRAVVRQAKARLETAGVRLLGAVLTERTFPIPDAIYRRL